MRMRNESGKYSIRIRDLISESFKVKNGLKQEDPLSILLFDLMLEQIIRTSKLKGDEKVLKATIKE